MVFLLENTVIRLVSSIYGILSMFFIIIFQMILGLTYSFSIISAIILVIASFLIGNEIDRLVLKKKNDSKIQVNDTFNTNDSLEKDNKLEFTNKTMD